MKKVISVELLQDLINVIVGSRTEYTFIQLNKLIESVQRLEDYKEEDKEEDTSTEEEKE